MKAPPERLGSFYLGARFDPEKGIRIEDPINYDARDLTTHAVCLGMTGSGKTGLCICLLEEAALDQVPAIIVDPKGDITNLLLQFPDLNAKDFEPWINVDDARRKGLSVKDYSLVVADTWKKGLEDWGINPERISQSKDSVEQTIFTPGSEAGVPVSILSSLASPKLDFETDGEAARELIGGVVAALIDLMGLKLDPIRSVEAVLLCNIFEYYWSRDEGLTLEKLITSIQKPPFSKLGVFDLEAFYPAKDRFQLAMAMNTLIASPSFASWLRGESLDVDKLLYSAQGKPRHSIFYLAHLSDSERMFFVTLLLESIVTWVRRQEGTTSLRAILYFDEAFGFMPPVAEPSSKRPLMTLLKQARAFGLGVALVTQNPVDIDYKGLTNTGTWFIGKLQAERDKEKVIEGLKGAIRESGGIGEETDYDILINKLTSRVFILHNIHQGPPLVFQSRWAMSYLRGPLTKPQITELMKDRRVLPTPTTPPETLLVQPDADLLSTPPSVDPKITQVYLTDPIEEQQGAGFNQASQPSRLVSRRVYGPQLLAKTRTRYYDRRLGIDTKSSDVMLLSPTGQIETTWDNALRLPAEKIRYLSHPEDSALYRSLPSQINAADKISRIGRSVIDYILLNSSLKILTHTDLNLVQRQGEDERSFNIRLRDAARERRDKDVNAIQNAFDEKIGKLEDKIKSLETSLSSDQAEYEARKREEYLGAGETLLGFFIGRRRTTGMTTASRRRRMTEQAEKEVQETKVKLEDVKRDVDELEAELKQEVDKATKRWEDPSDGVAVVELKPRRSDIVVDLLAIAWVPMPYQ